MSDQKPHTYTYPSSSTATQVGRLNSPLLTRPKEVTYSPLGLNTYTLLSKQMPRKYESFSEDGWILRWRIKFPLGAHVYTLILLLPATYRPSGPCEISYGVRHSFVWMVPTTLSPCQIFSLETYHNLQDTVDCK